MPRARLPIALSCSSPCCRPRRAPQGAPPPFPKTEEDRKTFAETVCSEIDARATEHALPQSFMARLIWKESLFDPGAVSPKGAQGIAQFMPGTAKRRGLDDPFDAEAGARRLRRLSGRTAQPFRQSRPGRGGLQCGRGAGAPLARGRRAAFPTRRRTTCSPSPAAAMRNGRRRTPASTSPRSARSGSFADQCRSLVMRELSPQAVR